MVNRYVRNIYNCVIFPTLVSGLITIGTYNLFVEVGKIYPISFSLLCSGGAGYLIGSLIRSKFEWIKE